VSRADLARWPVIGVAARRVGTVFVDRQSKQSGAAAISTMVQAIERGRGVMVYPEGTTFEGDEVHPFRAGAFLTAQRTGAEIVPIGLAYEGAAASYGEETFAEHMVRVSAAPMTRASIVVGDPIPSGGQDVDALREHARSEVQALVHHARRALLGEP
jgi:lyso-ornithine lipid O-acyltransferase